MVVNVMYIFRCHFRLLSVRDNLAVRGTTTPDYRSAYV